MGRGMPQVALGFSTITEVKKVVQMTGSACLGTLRSIDISSQTNKAFMTSVLALQVERRYW